MIRVLVTVILVLVGSCSLPGQVRKSVSDTKGRDAIRQFVQNIPGAQGGIVLSIGDEAVVQAFPSHRFYVLRFAQYPVAQVLSEGFTYNNLFVVPRNGRAEILANSSALENFFRSELMVVTNEAQAKLGVKAWLRLTQEFHQDGFFEFLSPDNSLAADSKRDGITASGRTVVADGGNKGQIQRQLSRRHDLGRGVFGRRRRGSGDGRGSVPRRKEHRAGDVAVARGTARQRRRARLPDYCHRDGLGRQCEPLLLNREGAQEPERSEHRLGQRPGRRGPIVLPN